MVLVTCEVFLGWLQVSGSPSFILAKRLNLLKRRLREWNKDVFGHLDSKMAYLVYKIKSFDEKEQQLSLSLGEKIDRLQVKLSVVRSQIDIFWCQRAKQHLMEDGDRNTKFFHRVANSRRKFNAIESIKVEGDLHVDDSSLKGAIVQFYEKLYHENSSYRSFLEGISYSSISLEDARELKKEFSEEEVWKAINDLGEEKAPGRMVSILLFFSIAGTLSRAKLWAFLLTFTIAVLLRKA